jgi:3-deoxy-D-manno-octulosonic-acid transferase
VSWLYALASYLGFALVAPWLLLRAKTREGLARRLGRYPKDFLPARAGPRVWMHGASAGDLLALLPILRELKARRPDAQVVVSCMTNSGALMARERLGEADAVTYVPWDLPGATRRAMEALRPDLLVLEYAELWPNLIRAARRAGAKIALTNGRLSPGRLRWYRWLFALTGNALAELDLLMMRDEDERERAIALGAPRDRVHATGNTKFDTLLLNAAPAGDDAGLARALGAGNGRLWLCGSTHEDEEALLFDVFVRLRAEAKDLRLVVAPRYIERASRVHALAGARGLSARLRSAGDGAGAEVVVLDSIGELARAYRLADLVFVGGSFTARGGQNILEPAACGKPVLFGPHMENFFDSVRVLLGRGGIQVKSAEQLFTVARELLSRPDRLRELGAMAEAAVLSVRGATPRNVELLLRLLP